MSRSADDYQRSTLALLPRGMVWPRDPDSQLAKLARGWAEEMARLDARALVLREEADPRTTVETVTDWERVLGLPDPCRPILGGTLAERREDIERKLKDIPGQSRAFFIALAAEYGYAITIEEFDPFTVAGTVDMPILGEAWAHTWRVHAPEVPIEVFTTLTTCDQPLRSWHNADLECPIKALRPAHTVLQFAYDIEVPVDEEDWGFVALIADEIEDWGSVADAHDDAEDWGSVT
jgi:uncharacterized protein YmfQ (DUF2313 family)